MKRAFLDAYERELSVLYERAKEFAEDYPGIAERLGGLTRNNLDPAVGGLLEGAAFLAARVHMKLDSEFQIFTDELLERLLPNFLAPTPSVLLVQAMPPMNDDDLMSGQRHAPGGYMDARYVDRDQRISCRFRLSSPLEIWPLEVAQAALINTPARLQAMGLETGADTVGGLHLVLRCPAPDAPKKKSVPLSGVGADALTFYLVGAQSDSALIYEHLFCNVRQITLRHLDARGDPVFVRLPLTALEPVGFDTDHTFFPEDSAVFHGFTLLREFFMFPQKYLAFRLTGLRDALAGVSAGQADLIFEMNNVRAALAPRVKPEHFRLNAAIAINLFEENSSQVRLDARRHEYVVVPDSSPASHYEVNRLLDVGAYYQGVQRKVPVYPLYALPPAQTDSRSALFFTSRRRERRLTEKERRFGRAEAYRGTETLISIYEPSGLDDAHRVQRLQVRTLCTNRHLPSYLPLAESEADFRLNDNVEMPLRAISGPTAPRESITDRDSELPHRMTSGPVAWRLVAYLSFNPLGIDDRGSRDGAGAVRELLSLFFDPTEPTVERQIQGVRSISTRAVTRSIERDGAYLAARGLEITLKMDERAFEGSSIVLLGAVLDRFFSEYCSINSFTQLVLVSEQRGVLKTFAPRSGHGPLL